MTVDRMAPLCANRVLICLLAVGLAVTPDPGRAQDLNLYELIGFRADVTPDVVAFSGRPRDVGIDDNISVRWDEAALIQALGRSLGILASGDPLDQRIEFLRGLTAQFMESQAALMQFREAAATLAAARLAGVAQSETAALEVARNDASNRFSAVAVAAIDGLLAVDEGEGFDIVGAQALIAAADEAVLQDSYEALARAMGDFLEPSLQGLARELAGRVGEGRQIRVYMSAWMSSSGTSRRLHVDGYDDIATGDPTPFPRFQFAMAERTKRELESARQFQSIVEDPGALKTELESGLRAVAEEMTALTETLRSDVLIGELRRLERDLRGQSVGPLVEQVRQGRELLEALTTVPVFDTVDDVAVLMTIVDSFDAQIRSFLAAFSTLGTVLPNLAVSLGDRAAEFPDAIQTGTVHALDEAGRALRERAEIQAVAQRVGEIAIGLGLSRRVLDSGRGVNETARSVDPNVPLDTHLDLTRAGERHPGDRIDLRARVVIEDEAGTETSLAQTRQTLRLRVQGVYLQPRGALIFADPRTGGFDNVSFQPTIGVSYVAHYGWMGKGFWNDFLDPGIGLTVALHQFDPDKDFELGIAGTVTILRDLFFVGYGRNLQARADFFFVGVNPLALGDLWRLSGSGPPAGQP